ncbi:MAG: class I SAM-dependent methyltransferase [Gemmatimonadales bacterium]
MTTDPQRHWENIYRTTAPTEVSWYQPEARLSMDLILRVAPDPETPIIDVGGGASTLVDALLDTGYRALTVLDVAPTAMALARERLGERAGLVRWIEGDVLKAVFSSGFDVWHDRAVFHFLTESSDRARYVTQVRHAVRPGGHVIVATFGPDGPTHCSGLEVARYSAEAIHDEFGAGFRLLNSVREDHRTPGGGTQAFVYCLCRAEPEPARSATQEPGSG